MSKIAQQWGWAKGGRKYLHCLSVRFVWQRMYCPLHRGLPRTHVTRNTARAASSTKSLSDRASRSYFGDKLRGTYMTRSPVPTARLNPCPVGVE